MHWPDRVQTICCILGIISLVVFYATIDTRNIGWITLGSFLLTISCFIGYHWVGFYESKTVRIDTALIKSDTVLINPPKTLNLSKNSGTYNYVASSTGECNRCKEKPSAKPTRTDGYIDSDNGNFTHLECLHNDYKARKY